MSRDRKLAIAALAVLLAIIVSYYCYINIFRKYTPTETTITHELDHKTEKIGKKVIENSVRISYLYGKTEALMTKLNELERKLELLESRDHAS